MRRILGIAALLATGGPAAAQDGLGLPGACMIESPAGVALTVGACRRLPAYCEEDVCETPFFWIDAEFTTIITGGPEASLRESTAMDEQPANAPDPGDARDCVLNTVSDALFCWVPGAQAQALATDGAAARAALIDLADGAMAAPSAAEHRVSAAARPPAAAPLLEPMQGKYRPADGWSCGEIGIDGGATAVLGAQLVGERTVCDLSDGRPVGAHGAALFTAYCSGAGEVWEDEILLRRDAQGALAVLRAEGVTVWQACG